MTIIEELIMEVLTARERFWFVEEVKVIERTDSTVTLHVIIAPKLFIQVFFSQRSQRFSSSDGIFDLYLAEQSVTRIW